MRLYHHYILRFLTAIMNVIGASSTLVEKLIMKLEVKLRFSNSSVICLAIKMIRQTKHNPNDSQLCLKKWFSDLNGHMRFVWVTVVVELMIIKDKYQFGG